MYHAKKKAKEHIEDIHAKTCNKLRHYAKIFRAANLGFVVKLLEKINPKGNLVLIFFFYV